MIFYFILFLSLESRAPTTSYAPEIISCQKFYFCFSFSDGFYFHIKSLYQVVPCLPLFFLLLFFFFAVFQSGANLVIFSFSFHNVWSIHFHSCFLTALCIGFWLVLIQNLHWQFFVMKIILGFNPAICNACNFTWFW